jgi:Gpi18-like mannosyltransferase
VAAEGETESAAGPALNAFVATRLPVLAIGYLAVRLVGIYPPPVEPASWRVYTNELLNLSARWDAYWYYSIATEGYRWTGRIVDQQSVVFFPFYPLLMRLGGGVAAGHALLAGAAVSLASFLVALIYLYRLARLDLPPNRARLALALLASYPFAIFFGAPYTESVFLLEIVAAFYYLRCGRPAAAGAAALLAGLTRPNGCVLALPLACLALGGTTARLKDLVDPLRAPKNWPGPALVASLMPIAGALLYSSYLYAHFGHAFIWISNQTAWGVPLLPHPVVEPMVGPRLSTPYASTIVLVANIVALALAASTLRPLTRRFGIAYALLVVVYVVPAIVAHPVTSAGRFTSVLFPMFLSLAADMPLANRTRWIAAFGAGQAVAAALFYTWRPLV